MRTTDEKRLADEAHGRRLSHWTLGIGGVAFLTMFFNPLSLLGIAAVVPGVKAVRTHAPRRGLAIFGMVLGVLATLGVVTWLLGGDQ